MKYIILPILSVYLKLNAAYCGLFYGLVALIWSGSFKAAFAEGKEACIFMLDEEEEKESLELLYGFVMLPSHLGIILFWIFFLRR